jgi:predicted permease
VSALRRILARLRGLLDRGRGDRAFREELESHLALHIDDNLRAGLSPEEARRAALLALGGVTATGERYHDQRSVPWIEHLVHDVRFALRQLARQPAFTATAVAGLSLGLAAAVATFGFVDAVLVRPLPYAEPDRLLFVTGRTPQIPRAALSYPDFLDLRQQTSTLASLDVFSSRGYVLGGNGGADIVSGTRVSTGFFRTLGVAPALGRDFRDGEDAPGAPGTAILSHGAWQARFGGDPAVVGRTIDLNDQPYVVIGVLPASFAFAPTGGADVWTALRPVEGTCDVRRSCHGIGGIGRLRDGASAAAARADLSGIASRLEARYPDSNRDQGVFAEPLATVIAGDLGPILLLVMGGAALLLLLAGVNAASLLLVRSEYRRHELTLRGALGATRGRLLRQFAAESALLAGLSALLAIGLVRVGLDTLLRLVPADLRGTQPALDGLAVNGHMVAAALLLALALTVLLTLAPLARLPRSIRDGLAGGGRAAVGSGWRRFGFRLVVVELALATVLLASAGLLARSVTRLLSVDLGFHPEQVVALRVSAAPARYAEPAQVVRLAHALLERVGQLPGVEAAGLTSVLPVSFNGNTEWLRFVGQPFHGEHNEVNMRDVSAGYFDAIGAALVRGRGFTAGDTRGAARVAIINRTLARQYFGGRDPLGTQIGNTSLTPDSIRTIVGIVDDVREGPLDEEVWPTVYYPFDQDVDRTFALVVRSATGAAILPSVTAAVGEVDPGIGRFGAASLPDRIAASPGASLRRSVGWLIAGFAAVALLLAVVGLYGVIAYSVEQRRREIGVRLALGASRERVARMVLGESGRVAADGIAAGLAATAGAGTLLQPLLFATSPRDGPVLGTAALVLGAGALLGGYLPARRAASVDPLEAIRE